MRLVSCFIEDVDFEIENQSLITEWINESISAEGLSIGEISLIFCSDEYLLKVNQDHLNHDYYTDIITFDYCENKIVSGDLFISVDRVKENAEAFGVSFNHELSRVIIHGVLHLCGYKDKTTADAEEIREKENFYLSLLPNLK